MSTEIFKVGDPVFVFDIGWAKIAELHSESAKVSLSESGEISQIIPYKAISFTKYDLINGGWSQDRSVLNQPKKGDLVYVRNFKDNEWLMRFYSHTKNDYFCYDYQKTDGATEPWVFMEVENPLLKEKE